jgi:hypothetical protein
MGKQETPPLEKDKKFHRAQFFIQELLFRPNSNKER